MSIGYYLLKAIKNNAINFKRKQIHFLSLKKDLLPPACENGYTRVENYELGKEINAAIDQLSPMSSKVFQLHYINRLSYKEISLKLGISQSTIVHGWAYKAGSSFKRINFKTVSTLIHPV